MVYWSQDNTTLSEYCCKFHVNYNIWIIGNQLKSYWLKTFRKLIFLNLIGLPIAIWHFIFILLNKKDHVLISCLWPPVQCTPNGKSSLSSLHWNLKKKNVISFLRHLKTTKSFFFKVRFSFKKIARMQQKQQ